jgi:hypothetical protein
MQLSAEENVLRQGVSRCRCVSRHPFLALTHRLCPDSRQTVPSAFRYRSPVDQGRTMHLHGQWSPQLPMGTVSAVVLDCLPCKMTSSVVKERRLAKTGEVIFVAPQQATPPRSGFVQPFVAADGPPAPCQGSGHFGPPQNNTLDSCRGNGDVSRVMQKSWRRGAHVPWQALGHGCKGLPPQPMMFAKEEPLDDHHHYRL